MGFLGWVPLRAWAQFRRDGQLGDLSFYELFFACVFLSVFLLASGDISIEFFQLSGSDWLYLMILSLICTAYPFVVATNLLKKMSPFTIVLTNNLEPVYGVNRSLPYAPHTIGKAGLYYESRIRPFIGEKEAN
mgnify:CR=1 FL=1